MFHFAYGENRMKMLKMPEISPLLNKFAYAQSNYSLRRFPLLIAAHITPQIIKNCPTTLKTRPPMLHGEDGILHLQDMDE